MAGERVTQAEFARQSGVSKVAIGKWVKKGIVKLDAEGLLDPETARAAILAASHPAHAAARSTLAGKIAQSHAGATPEAGQMAQSHAGAAPVGKAGAGEMAPSAYMLAKTEREEWEAKRAALKFGEESGLLVRAAAVKAAFFGLSRQAQEALRTIPDRIAAKLAVETDPMVIRDLLDAELRQVIAIIATAKPFPDRVAPVEAAA